MEWIGTLTLKKNNEGANEDCGGYCYYDSSRKKWRQDMVWYGVKDITVRSC